MPSPKPPIQMFFKKKIKTFFIQPNLCRLSSCHPTLLVTNFFIFHRQLPGGIMPSRVTNFFYFSSATPRRHHAIPCHQFFLFFIGNSCLCADLQKKRIMNVVFFLIIDGLNNVAKWHPKWIKIIHGLA